MGINGVCMLWNGYLYSLHYYTLCHRTDKVSSALPDYRVVEK